MPSPKNTNGSIKIQPGIIIQTLIVLMLVGGFWRMWDTQSAQAITLGQMEVKMDHFEEIKDEVQATRHSMEELAIALREHIEWEKRKISEGARP